MAVMAVPVQVVLVASEQGALSILMVVLVALALVIVVAVVVVLLAGEVTAMLVLVVRRSPVEQGALVLDIFRVGVQVAPAGTPQSISPSLVRGHSNLHQLSSLALMESRAPPQLASNLTVVMVAVVVVVLAHPSDIPKLRVMVWSLSNFGK